MRAEEIAFFVVAFTFATSIVNQVDAQYITDHQRSLFGGTKVSEGYNYSDMREENINATIQKYGWNQAPGGLLNSFGALMSTVWTSLQWFLDFMFNATLGFGAQIIDKFFNSLNTDAPQLAFTLKSTVGAFVFICYIYFVIFFLRGLRG